MYNTLEHDLIELELPNIVYRVKKGEHANVQSHPFLLPLLTKIAKARPKWTLVGTRFALRNEGNAPHWASSFTVMDGNVELGEIRKEYNHSNGHDCYGINNQRMDSRRQRGYITRTKDLSKAFKIVTKEFHGKTTEEILKEANEACGKTVILASQRLASAYNGLLGNMRPSMLAFARQEWDAYREFAMANKVTETTLDMFPEAEESNRAGTQLQDSWYADNHLIVALRGSDYLIRDVCKDGLTTKVVTTDELTPHEKRCIGLLKIAEDGTFIPNVGVKVNATTIYVMKEQKDD